MSHLRRKVLAGISLWIFLSTMGAAQASEFLNLCQASFAKRDAFLKECQQHARPFGRIFLPGGNGTPVQESFRAWFDEPVDKSHFGLGCVLGPKDQILFLGIYFSITPSNLRLANREEFTFVDFNGNVGLSPPQDAPFTLLAIHKFTLPGRKPIYPDRNCGIGTFDPAINTTIEPFSRGWSRTIKISGGDPAAIENCSLSTKQTSPAKSQCFTKPFKSFVNETKSPIIYNGASIKITERGRVYVSEILWDKICKTDFRSAIESANFVKELCSASK